MRVAVCVSGACSTGNPKGDLVRNNAIQKAKFPNADFYYATWDGFRPVFEKLFPHERCEYFPEVRMHYHPYTDIKPEDHTSRFYQSTADWINRGGDERLKWSAHHTKQILIHSWLTKKIEAGYDVIVRTRFDAFISKYANFTQHLADTNKHRRANCFAATKQNQFNQLHEFNVSPETQHGSTMLDQLIIYPAGAIDHDAVNRLHKEKKLHAAEYGWCQVINGKHRNHDGWVNHDRMVLDCFLA